MNNNDFNRALSKIADTYGPVSCELESWLRKRYVNNPFIQFFRNDVLFYHIIDDISQYREGDFSVDTSQLEEQIICRLDIMNEAYDELLSKINTLNEYITALENNIFNAEPMY